MFRPHTFGRTLSSFSMFRKVTATDIEYFQDVVSPSGVITDSSELEFYNEDWLKKCKGHSKVALLPRSTDEVSALLAYCNEKKIAVVPQGGNTGLVGGSVPTDDEVVISLTRYFLCIYCTINTAIF